MIVIKSVIVTNAAASTGGGGTWGSITGTLSNQTDLQAALDLKQDLYLEFTTPDLSVLSNYTLVLTDKDTKQIRMDKATAITLTVPLNSSVAFPIGTQILVKRIGLGQLTFVATGGVTITTSAGALTDAGQNALMALIKTGTDTWDLDNGVPGGGSGDVVGPAGATGDDIVLFDGATGKLIKDSGVLLSSLATIAYVTDVFTKIIDYVTSSSHTGNTNETVLKTLLIPANTAVINGKIQVEVVGVKVGTAGNVTTRLYLNTTADLTGSPIIIGTSQASSTNLYYQTYRRLRSKNSLSSWEVHPVSTGAFDDVTQQTVTIATVAPNMAVAQYLVVSVQLANSADSTTIRSIDIEFKG